MNAWWQSQVTFFKLVSEMSKTIGFENGARLLKREKIHRIHRVLVQKDNARSVSIGGAMGNIHSPLIVDVMTVAATWRYGHINQSKIMNVLEWMTYNKNWLQLK